MGVSQYWDAFIEMQKAPKGSECTWSAPRGHDKELSDHERAALPSPFEAAHKRRLKIRHGQDAIGVIPHVKGA